MRNATDRNTITVTLYDDEGDEVEHELPARMEVCSRCEGHGTHLNPSIGEHAYTREEFEESFDEEGREEYFKRGGIYDVTCEECGGDNVVPVVDTDRLTEEQKKIYAEHLKHERQCAQWDAEDAYTRRMESGGY